MPPSFGGGRLRAPGQLQWLVRQQRPPHGSPRLEKRKQVPMSTVIRGSCLCGGVLFEVTPPLIRANHCHCSRCRKHSGTSVCTQARVWREQFRLVEGEDLVRVFGRGQGAVKAFCSVCGSSLFGGEWPEGRQVSIRMGAFDDDPGIRPQFHSYVDSRATWDEITDGLPQYPGAWSKNASPRTVKR